jgi:predicted nucleic acid-binding protein
MMKKRQGRAATFFCDTSVLVAASDVTHEHHAASRTVVAQATPGIAYCAAHALAELYSTLSGGRYLRVLPLEHVLQIVKRLHTVFTIVDVPAAEYITMLESAVHQQTRGGRIYDALHVHAAVQCDASVIYTWNEKDFRSVVPPELRDRVQTPSTS